MTNYQNSIEYEGNVLLRFSSLKSEISGTYRIPNHFVLGARY